MGSKEYRHLLNYAADLVVLLVEGVLFAFMWHTYFVPLMVDEGRIFVFWGHFAMVGLYLLIIFFFTRNLGGYRIGYLRIGDICLSQALAILCANIVALLQLIIAVGIYFNPGPLIVLTLIEWIFVIPWVILMRYIYVRLYPPKRMIVVFGEYSPQNLVSKINSRRERYDVCSEISVKVGYEGLYKAILEHEAVILSDLPSHMRNQILKFCFDQKKRTYITPKISDIIVIGSEKIHLFDTPLLLARNGGLTVEQRVIKRIIDIVLSVVAIIVSSPFMLIFASCIKLYDRGPIFYTQERLTRDEKHFQIIKFRSMVVDSERRGAQLARKGDPRITPIGRVLRATHLDELPQIFNIFKGEMSFVGPRPERAEIAAEYEELVPEFRFRLRVKAGLTGYAQVYGKYNTTPYDKLKLDLSYVENYSVWMDLKLMLMTFKIMFQKENTEGIDSDQRTAMERQEEKDG